MPPCCRLGLLGPVLCGLVEAGAELACGAACDALDSLCSSSCRGLACFRPACCLVVQTACRACNEACMLLRLVAVVLESWVPDVVSGQSLRLGMAGLVHQGALLAGVGDVASGWWWPVPAGLPGLVLASGGYCGAAVGQQWVYAEMRQCDAAENQGGASSMQLQHGGRHACVMVRSMCSCVRYAGEYYEYRTGKSSCDGRGGGVLRPTGWPVQR